MWGYKFTWERGKGRAAWIREKLNRALANAKWVEEFSNYMVHNLSSTESDHSPILVKLRTS